MLVSATKYNNKKDKRAVEGKEKRSRFFRSENFSRRKNPTTFVRSYEAASVESSRQAVSWRSANTRF